MTAQTLPATLRPRTRPWSAPELFAGLRRRDIALSDDGVAALVTTIDYAMVTEFDAQNFDAYLTRRTAAGLALTPDFGAFRAAWRRDEWNHYVGYRRLLHLMTGTPEADLHTRTVGRPCDFGDVEPFLADEFTICVAFAFDEMVTRFACEAATGLFRSFGHPAFPAFIGLVKRDEGYHFANLVDVVRLRHRHRTGECAELLDRLVEYDLGANVYRNTFLLDHDLDAMGEPLLRRCAGIVRQAMTRDR